MVVGAAAASKRPRAGDPQGDETMTISGLRSRRAGVRFGGLATALVVLGAAAAAQGPAASQAVDLGGVTFEAPAAWQKVQPKSSMRRAQLNVAPAEGDKEPAELIVFVFPEGAGSVEDNVARWQNQFKDASGGAPPVQSKAVKGKNVDVTRVAVAGTYNDPFGGKGPQAGFRLLGGIVQTPRGGYYLKMVGPEKTMAAAEKDFDAMLATLTAQP
jgi:hypothetical protein